MYRAADRQTGESARLGVARESCQQTAQMGRSEWSGAGSRRLRYIGFHSPVGVGEGQARLPVASSRGGQGSLLTLLAGMGCAAICYWVVTEKIYHAKAFGASGAFCLDSWHS